LVNVFLIPGTELHLKSIRDGVSLGLIEDALRSEEKEKLRRIYENKPIRLWGALPSLRSTWEVMNVGDIALFSPRGSGCYKYYGEVALKLQNKDLARKMRELIWEKEGEKYEYIFFVKDVREISVRKEKINGLAGYKGIRVPTRLMRVASSEAVKAIINFLKLYAVGEVEEEEERPGEISKPSIPSHRELRDMILRVGELEGFEAQKEFPIDRERLDCIWKRRGRVKPDVSFEVQKGGDFYGALVKLKEAWDKWGCVSVLVTTEEYIEEAKRWLGRAFHEMEKDARVVHWTKIKEWLEALEIRRRIRDEIRI
jgi:predicted RNA-binding protein